MPAYDEDEALEVVRLDGLQRGNAEVGSGEHVVIRRAESQAGHARGVRARPARNAAAGTDRRR